MAESPRRSEARARFRRAVPGRSRPLRQSRPPAPIASRPERRSRNRSANPQSSRDITVRAFREVPLGVAMPAGHALAGRSGLRFNQLAGLDVIRPLPPLEIAEQFAALEAASGLQLRTALAANNIGMVRSLVARGAGLSVVSRIDVAAELQQGVIAFVPLTEKPLRPTTLALCHARQGQLSSAARLLMRIAEEREVWDG
ncbi:LysR substrate-binding domain-containing protein [Paenirhodobacter populi]|uniref:LysR substrate-binding domain-containing protein n=1 Tax=Paenirhodobacter populi TaxID=2306993 RepID=A0A443IY52_9RHOB|nr:LysR substrate-binding domain-containing protein [Sinirhodobacter populi]RWR13111.1 hypothetical protein D2T33_07930 [Sinirhodobacter populi]